MRAILERRDPRLFVVVGPCSIHDVGGGARICGPPQGARRPGRVRRMLLIMRVYFEKPRTTVGWKGLINDPDLDDSFHIEKGHLARARAAAVCRRAGTAGGHRSARSRSCRSIFPSSSPGRPSARAPRNRRRIGRWRAACRRPSASRTARTARSRPRSMRCSRCAIRIIFSASRSRASPRCSAPAAIRTRTSCCAAAADASTTTR